MRQVKCIKPLDHLTKDRIYTMVGEPSKDAKWLTVVDDRGVCTTYDSARFEVIHSPKATPDFRQMQHIADEVKITCPVVEQADKRKSESKPLCKNHKICGSPVEAERYKFCYDCWWAQDPRNKTTDLTKGAKLEIEDLVVPDLVEVSGLATAPIKLHKALAEDALLIRLNARREQALEDSDANLAALLYDCMSVLKRGAQ